MLVALAVWVLCTVPVLRGCSLTTHSMRFYKLHTPTALKGNEISESYRLNVAKVFGVQTLSGGNAENKISYSLKTKRETF